MASTLEGNVLSQSNFPVSMDLSDTGSNLGSTGITLHHKSRPAIPRPTNSPTDSRNAQISDASQRKSPKQREPRSPKGQKASEGAKSKRVRTGCLTCRERHLKCDEALPRCQNCSKSGRTCKRGVRLNFIDTQTLPSPHHIAHPPGTRLAFQDESRDIASEYLGGFERYPPLKKSPSTNREPASQFDFTDVLNAPVLSQQTLPVSPSLLSTFPEASQAEVPESMFNDSSYSTTQTLHDHQGFLPKSTIQSSNSRVYINNPEEVLLMQVFVEEVGLWMDSMDANKHFTNILPFHALSEPMLLNAFMACGARHLHLVNPSFGEDRALHYYNTASRELLSHLQNPNRDPVLCATTAVILNVYEVMCESAMQRMNHIAGARALIKECRWNGKTPGIGGACFWLNVGMELLSCLHFNWQMAWDPDTWEMDMDTELTPSESLFGEEEIWTHRMVYICAKIANFRATIPQFQGPDRNAHELRLHQRCNDWNTFKRWCDEWAKYAPRSMMPVGYLQPWQTTSKSSFPEVWLIQRSAVVGRLFYHTACLLLAKIHPLESEFSPEMRSLQQTHAHDICGIVTHVKDRGVATVSIRCLAIAAECLVSREAQEEVLGIFDKIIKETGWRIGFLKSELHEKWGWNGNNGSEPTNGSADTSSLGSNSLLNSAAPSVPSRRRMPSGIVNPLMATADFSMENHPYQAHYVAPHSQLDNYQYGPY